MLKKLFTAEPGTYMLYSMEADEQCSNEVSLRVPEEKFFTSPDTPQRGGTSSSMQVLFLQKNSTRKALNSRITRYESHQ